jgi:hypothetical protein
LFGSFHQCPCLPCHPPRNYGVLSHLLVPTPHLSLLIAYPTCLGDDVRGISWEFSRRQYEVGLTNGSRQSYCTFSTYSVPSHEQMQVRQYCFYLSLLLTWLREAPNISPILEEDNFPLVRVCFFRLLGSTSLSLHLQTQKG